MADELQENVIRFITHYQAKLELENNPEREIVRILAQFAKVRMSPGYLKLTGVRRAIQPYLSWNGEIGSLAKGLEENWSKGGYQAPKTKSGSSNGSDSSPHSSGNNNDDNNHRSSHSSSSSSNNNHRSSHSNNSSKSHRSSHGGSSSNNNNSHRSSATPAAAATAPADSAKERIKKRHGAEDPSSNPKKIKVDVEEQLFGSPALIKAADRGKDVAAKPTKPARKTEKAAAKAEAGSSSSSKNSRNGSKSGEAKPADSRAPKNDSSSDGGDADPDMRVMLIKKKHKAASSPGETTASGDRGKKGGKSRDSSSGSAAAASSPRKRTKKLANTATEEGFDASIASFEDVLGIPDYTRSSSAKRKKANNNNNNPVSSTRSKVATEAPAAKSSSSDRKTENSFKGPSTSAMKPVDRSSPTLVQIKPILHDAASTSTLPEIQPNYKPLRFSMPDGGIIRPRKTHAEANEGSFFSSRHNRTQVFSGRRQASTEVPKLFDICLKTLQENINDLTYTGGIPCDILQPVFEKCSANQLYNIEYYNPYLVDDTGPLWEKHCEREFKGSRRGEHETWRDLYLRLMDERDAKLKRVTANISAAVAKTVPVRKTQLAFVDVPVKPERHVARQQAKMGTNPELGRKAVAASKSSSLKQQLAKPPPGADLVSIPSVPDPGSSAAGASQQKVVKKVAPLMQKTLKFMKNRFRR